MPLELMMVTTFPASVQAPPAVMVGRVLLFDVAAMGNVAPNVAVAGAPVKVTVGATGVTVRVPVALLAAKSLC